MRDYQWDQNPNVPLCKDRHLIVKWPKRFYRVRKRNSVLSTKVIWPTLCWKRHFAINSVCPISFSKVRYPYAWWPRNRIARSKLFGIRPVAPDIKIFLFLHWDVSVINIKTQIIFSHNAFSSCYFILRKCSEIPNKPNPWGRAKTTSQHAIQWNLPPHLSATFLACPELRCTDVFRHVPCQSWCIWAVKVVAGDTQYRGECY